LELRGIAYERQIPVVLDYKGLKVETAYRLDLRVECLVIVELKAVEKMERVYEAQLLTHLRLADLWLGLLINFNVPVLKDGIKRLVNG
jgi:GxxExxY protein